MKLEAGKGYMRRDGTYTVLEAFTEDEDAVVDPETCMLFERGSSNGHCFGADCPFDLDLVKELERVVPIRVGGTYRRRDGTVVTLTRLRDDPDFAQDPEYDFIYTIQEVGEGWQVWPRHDVPHQQDLMELVEYPGGMGKGE